MIRHLIDIARLEYVASARLRWIHLLAAAYALLALGAAYAAGAAAELGSVDGFARTTMALVPVALILAPLSALVLGVSAQTPEPGADDFLFTQPVSRRAVVIGRWAGEAAALGTATAGGLGAGAIVISANAGLEGLAGYAFFTASAVVLGWIFLAIAAAIAAAARSRTAALAGGTFAWFIFVLLYDGVALTLAGWLSGPAGGRVLFASVFGNPADLVRVGVLMVAGHANVLGAAGDAWLRFLGGPAAALAWTTAGVVLWTIAPLAAAVRLIGTRDL
jgi:Cu-processing system permease protein